MSLHIYQKHPEADAYRVGGFYSPYCLVATYKRFTDAELSAAYWFSQLRLHPLTESNTLYRFAEAQHFDEDLS